MRNSRFIKLTLLVLAIILYSSCPQEVSDLSPPKSQVAPVPTNLILNEKWLDSLRLSWDCEEGGERYYIYRSDTLDGEYLKVGESLTMLFTESSLLENSIYYYRIASFNSELGESEKSAPLKAATAIKSPDNFKVTTKEKDKVTLSWSPVANATGYKIYRDKGFNMGHRELLIIPSKSIVTYTDYGLIEGSSYYYRIQAINDNTESRQSSSLFIPMDVRIPDNLKAIWQDTSPKGIKLNWNPVASADPPAQGYKIYRSLTSPDEGYEELVTLNIATTSYLDEIDVVKGGSVYYKIATYYYTASGIVVSQKSSHVESAAKPTDPGDCLTITSTKKDQITIQWIPPASATGIKIYRWKDAIGSDSDAVTKLVPGISTNSFIDTGLSPNSLYFYQITYYVDLGSSLLESSKSTEVSGYTLPAPCVVSSVEKDAATGRKITINWKGVTGANEYILEFRKSSDISGMFNYLTTVIDDGRSSYSYEHSGLDALTGYQYTITVKVDHGGTIGEKFSSPTTTTPVVTSPDCPATVTVDSLSKNSIKVSWSEVTDIPSGYTLQYKVYRDSGSTAIATINAPEITFTDTGLADSNKEYSYTVKTSVEYKESGITKTEESSHSDPPAKDTTFPTEPKVIKGTVTSSSVALEISTTDGATTFDIYRSPKGGTPALIAENQTIPVSSTSLTYTDSAAALTEFTEYSYFAVAKNVAGSSEKTELPVLTRPKAPANLKLGTITKDSVQLSWDPLTTDTTGYDVIYVVTQTDNRGSTPTIKTDRIDPKLSTLETTFTGLDSNVTYSYTVKAEISSSGSHLIDSDETPSLDALTCPAKPIINFSNRKAGSVDIEIGAPTGVSEVNLRYNLAFKEFGAGTKTDIATDDTNKSHSKTGLASFTEYIFSASAVNTSGSAAADDATLVTNPAQVSTFTLDVINDKEIKLTWEGGDSGTVGGYTIGYELYRSTDAANVFLPGNRLSLGSLGSTPPYNFTDSGLSGATKYYYELYAVAVNDSDSSDKIYSAPATASDTTLFSIAGPASFTVSNSSETTRKHLEIELSWKRVADVTDYTITYELHRSLDGTTYDPTFEELAQVPASEPNVIIKKASSRPSILGPLAPGVKYYYKVRAVATKISDASRKIVGDFSPSLDALVDIPKPASLDLSVNAEDKAVLSWDNWNSINSWEAPNGYKIDYLIYRAIENGGSLEYTEISTIPQSSDARTSFTDTATPSGKVHYAVHTKATKIADSTYSLFSEEPARAEVFVEPAAPANLKAITNADGYVELSWDAAVGVPAGYKVKYIISRKLSAGGSYSHKADIVESGGVTPTKYIDPDTAEATNYYYAVRTVVIKPDASEIIGTELAEIEIFNNPAPPANLTVTTDSDNNVKLDWDPFTLSGYTVKYLVYRKPAADADYSGATPAEVTTNTHTEIPPADNSHYTYVVRTLVEKSGALVKATGKRDSNEVDIFYNPAPPANLTITTDSDNNIKLDWDPVTTGIPATGYTVKYLVYRKLAADADYSGATPAEVTTNTHTETPPADNSHYTYVVRTLVQKNGTTLKATGKTASSEVDIFYNPAPPANLTITTDSDNNIKLDWDPVTTGIPATGYTVKYLVYRKPAADADYSGATPAEVTTNTHTETPPTDNSRYTYVVRTLVQKNGTTLKATGKTASNEVDIFYNPTPPANLTLTIDSDNNIKLDWDPVTTGIPATGYTVKYLVYRKLAADADYSGATPVEVTTNTHTETPPADNSHYRYVVRTLVQKNGTTIKVAGKTASNEVDIFYNPAPPANLTVTTDSDNNIKLDWDPVTTGIPATGYTVKYLVYRKPAADADYSGATPAEVTTNTHTETPPTDNSHYTYVVRTLVQKNGTTLKATGKTASNEVDTFYNPTPPANLTVTTDSDNNIKLDWDPVTTGIPATGYTVKYLVYRKLAADADYSGATPAEVTTNTHTETPPTDNKSYTYVVRTLVQKNGTTLKAAGKTDSNEVEIFYNPTAPTNLKATLQADKTTVKLSWDAVTASGYTVKYEIYRSAVDSSSYDYLNPVATITDIISTTITGLTTGTDYYFKVRTVVTKSGVTGKGKTYSNEIYLNTATKPLGTGTIAINPISSTELKVSWDAVNVTDGYTLGYRIERSLDSAFGTIDSLSPTIAIDGVAPRYSFTDSALSPNTTYYYRIYTRQLDSSNNLASESATAAEKSGLTKLAAPTVSFTSASGNELLFELSGPAGGSYTYDVTYAKSIDFSDSPGTLTGQLAGALSISSLANNTTYYVKAIAKDGSTNSSDESASAQGTTDLAAPTSLTVTDSSGTVTLTWAAVSGADQYVIEISTGGGAYTVVKGDATGTTYSYLNSTVGTHSYRIKAVDSGSGRSSSYKDGDSAITIAAPAAPASLTAALSGGNVTLSWTAVSGAAHYVIEISTGGGAYTVVKGDATGTTHSYANSTAGTHKYRIKAVNSNTLSSAYTIAGADVVIP